MMAAALSNCPLCSATAREGAEECHSCGAIFAKVLAKRERERQKAADALRAAEAPPPVVPTFDRKKARAVAIAVVCAWMAGLALYYRAAMRDPRPRRAYTGEAPANARLRDPDTGRLGSVDVHVSPAAPRPAPLSDAPTEPAPPAGTPAPDPDFDD